VTSVRPRSVGPVVIAAASVEVAVAAAVVDAVVAVVAAAGNPVKP
jgi:hypothetical protein